MSCGVPAADNIFSVIGTYSAQGSAELDFTRAIIFSNLFRTKSIFYSVGMRLLLEDLIFDTSVIPILLRIDFRMQRLSRS